MSNLIAMRSRLVSLLVALVIWTTAQNPIFVVASQAAQSCLPCSLTSLRYDAEHNSIDKRGCPDFQAVPTLQWPSLASYLFSEEYPYDYFWLAYMGDSLMRHSYYGWTDILHGEEFERGEAAPSPQFVNGYQFPWIDRFFCCRVNPQDRRPWGCKNINTWESRDLTDTVQAFLSPNDTEKSSFAAGTKSFCLTFHWLPRPTDLFVQQLQRLLKVQHPPQTIALNPGLHALFDDGNLTDYANTMDDIIRVIASDRKNAIAGPRVLLHDTSTVVEKNIIGEKKGLTNERVEIWNRFVRQSIRKHQMGIERRILVRVPVNKFTKGSQAEVTHDGVHYGGNYSVLLANTDFGMAVGPWTDGFCDLMVPTEGNDGDMDDLDDTVV